MFRKISAGVPALSREEIYDLIRGGLVLAVTVALALLVPPTVWGGGEGEGTATPNVEATLAR